MPDSLRPLGEGLPTLPLAENIDPELFRQNAALLAQSKRGRRPGIQFKVASNELELGLATGTEDLVDNAFDTLRDIVASDRYDLGVRPHIDAHRMLAYEASFRTRLSLEDHDTDDAAEVAKAQAYRNIGTLMREVVTLDFQDPRLDFKNPSLAYAWGRLGELIVDGALLRDKDPKAVVFPGSVREESSTDGTKAGHDTYLWFPKAQGTEPPKLPISVGMQFENANARLSVAHRKTTHPDVAFVPVTPILSKVLSKHPEVIKARRQKGTKYKVTQIDLVTDMMQREAHGGVKALDASETAILDAVTRQVRYHTLGKLQRDKRDAAHKERSRDPLGQSLAAKLRAAGFGTDTAS